MKSDKLIHEYFHLVPDAFFELLGVTPACSYDFSSPVLKETERRLDGLLQPDDPGQPRYFLEFQGYLDPLIYWRALQQVALFHNRDAGLNGSPSQVVILFLDSAHDPGPETLGLQQEGSTAWLTRAILSDLLEGVGQPSPVLNVLRPLAATEVEVAANAGSWMEALRRAAELPPETRQRLAELLLQLVVQKLRHMSRKEIEQMLQLTPLEETVVGQELIAEGLQRGLQQGLQQDLYAVLDARFGHVSPAISQRIEQLTDTSILRRLHREAIHTPSLEAFEELLAEI